MDTRVRIIVKKIKKNFFFSVDHRGSERSRETTKFQKSSAASSLLMAIFGESILPGWLSPSGLEMACHGSSHSFLNRQTIDDKLPFIRL